MECLLILLMGYFLENRIWSDHISLDRFTLTKKVVASLFYLFWRIGSYTPCIYTFLRIRFDPWNKDSSSFCSENVSNCIEMAKEFLTDWILIGSKCEKRWNQIVVQIRILFLFIKVCISCVKDGEKVRGEWWTNPSRQ